jgi:hypothetical protein
LLQVAELLLADGLLEVAGQLGGRPHRACLAQVLVARLGFRPAGLVSGQDLPFPLAEHFHEGFNAGPQPLDLTGVDAHGPGELLLG